MIKAPKSVNFIIAAAIICRSMADQRPRPPTLHCLLSFQSSAAQSPINIPQEIGTHYRQFGILLLQDDRGNLVDTIVHDELNYGAVNINLSILQKWLNGRGKPPTWSSLIQVLRDIELSVLAYDIEQELHLRGRNI